MNRNAFVDMKCILYVTELQNVSWIVCVYSFIEIFSNEEVFYAVCGVHWAQNDK